MTDPIRLISCGYGETALWAAVIDRAVRDLRIIQELDGRDDLAKHTEDKLTRAKCDQDVHGWFDTDDFREVCWMAQVRPEAIRDGVRKMGLLAE